MGKQNYNSGAKIQNNVASTLSLIGQVSEGYKKSGEDFIRKRKYPKELMEAEEILYNFFTTPVKWNERNWKYKTAFALSLLALGGVVYASSDTVKKTVDKNYEKGSKFVKEKYASLGAAPAVVVPAANESAVATPQVSETPQPVITPQPNYDYYDEDFKVGIVIEKYKEDTLFPNNVTRMLEVMSEKTPKRYEEAMNAFKQTPKKIVKSYYNYNYNSEREIGLDKITAELGGSDEIKNVLNADGSLYAEMIASAPLKEPLKNRYEGELYQHSNGMKYRVDAGIWTKENANKWLKEGRWFETIEGRLPTQEDKEGVDIEKYLIQ